MSKRWFARQKKFDGTFMPVLFHGHPPDTKSANGGIIKLKDVHEVPDYLDHLGLDQLNDYFEPSSTGER